MRKEIFEKNYAEILRKNQDEESRFQEEVNKFTDWTEQEVRGNSFSI